jgi:site-specific recombinase XerD
MTTIKLAVLRHTRAKDGSYKIRIAIGHQSETSYIVTKYRVNSLSNFRNGVVTGQPDAPSINIKLRKLLNQYDERLERIPNPSDYDCTQLRDMLENMSDHQETTTLGALGAQFCEQLRAEGRASYAHIIEYHLRYFLEFTHGDIFLNQITTQLIDDFSRHVRSNGASPSYEAIRLVTIRTLVNRAIKLQLVRYDVHPFLYWKKRNSDARDIDISVNDMRTLSQHKSKYKGIRRAVDMFMLSYYLGGMNLMDILSYDFRGYQSKPLSYIRQKTRNKKTSNRTIQFSIISEAYPIIERYMDIKTGKIDLHNRGKYEWMLSSIDRSLKTVSAQLNLECGNRITFYSARKSFVQHGFELGIPLEVLEYCIGQSMKTNRPIFNYVKIMSRHADEAICKIVEQIRNAPSSQTGHKL